MKQQSSSYAGILFNTGSEEGRDEAGVVSNDGREEGGEVDGGAGRDAAGEEESSLEVGLDEACVFLFL